MVKTILTESIATSSGVEERYTLNDKWVEITIDWKGRLPYPEGDRGTSGWISNLE